MCTQEKENRLNGITPEEVEKMWDEFMDETEPHTKDWHHWDVPDDVGLPGLD